MPSKKILPVLLAITIVFCIISVSQAERFDFAKISIDLPEGWNAVYEGDFVGVMADDQSCAFSISVEPLGAQPLQQVAEGYSERLKGSPPEYVGDGRYTFTFTNELGVKATAYFDYYAGTRYILTIISGGHPQLQAILDSVQYK